MNSIRPGAGAAVALLVCVVGFAGGCGGGSGNGRRLTAAEVRHSPNPELQSVAMTKDEIKNQHARAIHTTMRQIQDDLDMMLLVDRPSRMTIYPVP